MNFEVSCEQSLTQKKIFAINSEPVCCLVCMRLMAVPRFNGHLQIEIQSSYSWLNPYDSEATSTPSE